MLSRKEVVERLKGILNALRVEYSKILLFGSRATSDFDEESDWDFLIILRKEITMKEKKALWHEIYRRFHEYFPFESVDIILKDTESFENEKMVVNTIAHEVYLEGVEV